MRRRLPGGAVGLLDEHGPALVLPSYSGDCLAPWVSAERETLADAVELAQDPLAALHGWHGRLHGSYFLPIGHGGHNFSVGFNFLLPPPYRVVMLIAASLLLFAMILALLDRLGLDVSRLPVFGASAFASTHASRTARQASSTTPGHSALAHRSHHSSVDLALQHFSRESRDGGERETPGSPRSRTSSADRAYTALTVGTLYLVVATIAWLLFRYWVDGPPHGDPIGNHAQLYQAAVPLFALFVLFWPGNQLGRAVRYAYLRASWRIVIPSLRQRISFDDLLLADTLTSVGKVFGDVWLALCFLLPRNEHHTWYTGHGSWAIPWVHSIPYLIRLRQCLSEYFTSGPSVPYQDAKGGWHQRRSRKPLANALKYASSLPVIWLSTLHEHANDWKALEIDTRVLPPDYYLKGVRGYAQSIHRLWLLAVVVNSLFSFWWDVTNDWGLNILRPHVWTETLAYFARYTWTSVEHAPTNVRYIISELGPRMRTAYARLLHEVPRKVDTLDQWARRTAPKVQVALPLTNILRRVGMSLQDIWARWNGYVWLPPSSTDHEEWDAFDVDPDPSPSYSWADKHAQRDSTFSSLLPLKLRQLHSHTVLPVEADPSSSSHEPPAGTAPPELPQATSQPLSHACSDQLLDEQALNFSSPRESGKLPRAQDGNDFSWQENMSGEKPAAHSDFPSHSPSHSHSHPHSHSHSHPHSHSHSHSISYAHSHPRVRHGHSVSAYPSSYNSADRFRPSPRPTPKTSRGFWPSITFPSRIPPVSPSLAKVSACLSSWAAGAPPTRPSLLRDTSRGVAQRFSSWVYVVALVLDLVLRLTWSIKMSSHLQHLLAFEGAIALLELGEIVRRFGWLLFRVEWEFARLERARGTALTYSLPPSTALHGLGLDLAPASGSGSSSGSDSNLGPDSDPCPCPSSSSHSLVPEPSSAGPSSGASAAQMSSKDLLRSVHLDLPLNPCPSSIDLSRPDQGET